MFLFCFLLVLLLWAVYFQNMRHMALSNFFFFFDSTAIIHINEYTEEFLIISLYVYICDWMSCRTRSRTSYREINVNVNELLRDKRDRMKMSGYSWSRIERNHITHKTTSSRSTHESTSTRRMTMKINARRKHKRNSSHRMS